ASIHLSIAGKKNMPVVGSAGGKPRRNSSGSLARNSSNDRCMRRAALLAGTSRGSTRYLMDNPCVWGARSITVRVTSCCRDVDGRGPISARAPKTARIPGAAIRPGGADTARRHRPCIGRKGGGPPPCHPGEAQHPQRPQHSKRRWWVMLLPQPP